MPVKNKRDAGNEMIGHKIILSIPHTVDAESLTVGWMAQASVMEMLGMPCRRGEAFAIIRTMACL